MNKKLPKLIYKYSKIDQYFYELLINGELWFSSPSDFNDPFDSNIPWDLIYSYEEASKINKLKGIEGHLGVPKAFNFFDDFQEIRHSTGICCFSSVKDHMILWSHYAEKHKGVLMTFDVDELQKYFTNICKVIYKHRLPEVDINCDPKISFKTHVLNKSVDWSLEKEIRILENKPGTYKFPKRALKEIRFGYACVKKQAETIIELVTNCGYNKVKFTHAFAKRNEYGFNTKNYLINEEDFIDIENFAEKDKSKN